MRVTLDGALAFDSDPFSISIFAPRVVSQDPTESALLAPGQTTLTLVFSEPMDTAAFDWSRDAESFTGPQGVNLLPAVNAVDWSENDTRLTVTFAEQTAEGYYRLVLGSVPTDLQGNAMDQNQNEIPGEPDDGYTALFRIVSGSGPSCVFWGDLIGADNDPETG